MYSLVICLSMSAGQATPPPALKVPPVAPKVQAAPRAGCAGTTAATRAGCTSTSTTIRTTARSGCSGSRAILPWRRLPAGPYRAVPAVPPTTRVVVATRTVVETREPPLAVRYVPRTFLYFLVRLFAR